MAAPRLGPSWGLSAPPRKGPTSWFLTLLPWMGSLGLGAPGGGGAGGAALMVSPVPFQLPYTELEKVSGIEEAKHYLRQKLRELRL